MIASMMIVTTPVTRAVQRELGAQDGFFVAWHGSAHHAARQEDVGVDQDPGEEQKPDGQAGQRPGATGHVKHDALERGIVEIIGRIVALARGKAVPFGHVLLPI